MYVFSKQIFEDINDLEIAQNCLNISEKVADVLRYDVYYKYIYLYQRIAQPLNVCLTM